MFRELKFNTTIIFKSKVEGEGRGGVCFTTRPTMSSDDCNEGRREIVSSKLGGREVKTLAL